MSNKEITKGIHDLIEESADLNMSSLEGFKNLLNRVNITRLQVANNILNQRFFDECESGSDVFGR
jgi:hypothetical protein